MLAAWQNSAFNFRRYHHPSYTCLHQIPSQFTGFPVVASVKYYTVVKIHFSSLLPEFLDLDILVLLYLVFHSLPFLSPVHPWRAENYIHSQGGWTGKNRKGVWHRRTPSASISQCVHSLVFIYTYLLDVILLSPRLLVLSPFPHSC